MGKKQNMAIKALEQQPCEDAVSRQAVDELSKELVHTTRDKADFLCNFWEGLQKLPPVTPKEKTGHWIDTCPGYYDSYVKNAHCCSNCRNYYTLDWKEMNFCPNCGARMIEPQESENKEVTNG